VCFGVGQQGYMCEECNVYMCVGYEDEYSGVFVHVGESAVKRLVLCVFCDEAEL
jgi:hypothetical protein